MLSRPSSFFCRTSVSIAMSKLVAERFLFILRPACLPHVASDILSSEMIVECSQISERVFRN